VRVILALISVVLLLGACTGSPAPSAEPTSTMDTPTPAPGPARDRQPVTPLPVERFVPHVKGQEITDARAHLERRGFRARAQVIVSSACVADGLVLRQDPPPRSIRDVGSRVTLSINRDTGQGCGLGLPPAEPDLQAAGEAFVDFARGGVPDPALLGTEVALHLGGMFLHSIPARRAVHRLRYGWLCPNAGSYAARVCPFSAVRAIATHPGPMAVTGQAPQVPCGGGGFLSGRLPRTVTLTPDEGRTCVDYFAVELALDAHGRLAAVNLVWSEP
jgi:hypothetical protein